MIWASSNASRRWGPSIRKRLFFLRPLVVCRSCNLLIRGLLGLVIRVIFLVVDAYWAGQALPLRDCRQSSFEQRAKGGFIMYSHLGENLAVYIDIGLMNGIDQLAIAHAVHACGRINACYPQAAPIAFAITAGSAHL